MTSGIHIRGIDTGNDLNYDQVQSAGYRFVFIKATEATSLTMPGFQDRVTAALKANLITGVYHFARPDLDGNRAQAEADYFLQIAGDYIKEGYLRPALDMEDNSDIGLYPELIFGSPEGLAEWIKTWMDTVQNRTISGRNPTGIKPILYMTPYLLQYLNKTSIVNKYDVWIAELKSAEPASTDNPNTEGWNGWAFWQYEQEVDLAGNLADLDLFNGDSGRLQSFVIK
jgi:GH25 family lysozyme M1 (1,4-beta-N-acetylmuramidase)